MLAATSEWSFPSLILKCIAFSACLLVIIKKCEVSFLNQSGTVSRTTLLRQEQQGSSSTSSSRTILSYHLQKDTFVKELSSCVADDDCHIQFLHFGKTAGTTIERIFQDQIFEDPYVEHPCCWDDAVERMQKRADEICRRKFFSFQVNPTQFKTIANTCNEILSNDNAGRIMEGKTGFHRVFFLTAIREPIARQLSDIHQICNKPGNRARNSDALNEACDACSYDLHPDLWMHFVEKDNHFWHDLHALVTGKGNFTNPSKSIATQYAVLDSADTTEMLVALKDVLPVKYSQKFSPQSSTGHANKEKKDICSFGMKSELIKGLQPSTVVYRDMTIGRF